MQFSYFSLQFFFFYGLCDNSDENHSASLRSKRFRLVSEQRKTEERDSRFWPREKWNKSQKIFRTVFDSRSSFFAPKPHGNACYAGYHYAVLFTLV